MDTIEKLKLYSEHHRFGFEHREELLPFRILEILSKRELPKMVWLVQQVVPALKEERIAETKSVFATAAENDLHSLLTLALMDLSVGKDYALEDKVRQIVGHSVSNKEGRKELWGTEWELPVRLAAGIMRDWRDNINLKNPTRWDLRHSATFSVARVFIDVKDGEDTSAARNRQNKEIDKFISKWPVKTTGEQKTRICLKKLAESREAKREAKAKEIERCKREADAKRRKEGLFTAAEIFSIATDRIIPGVENYVDTYDDLGVALKHAGYTEDSVPERLNAYAKKQGFDLATASKELVDFLKQWKDRWMRLPEHVTEEIARLCKKYGIPESVQF